MIFTLFWKSSNRNKKFGLVWGRDLRLVTIMRRWCFCKWHPLFFTWETRPGWCKEGICWNKLAEVHFYITRHSVAMFWRIQAKLFAKSSTSSLHKPQQIVLNVKMLQQIGRADGDYVIGAGKAKDDVGPSLHLELKLLAMIIARTVVQSCQSTVNKVKGYDDSLTVTTFG